MSYIANKVLNLSKQLMPSGRAWIVPPALYSYVFLVDEDGIFLVDEDGNYLVDGSLTTVDGGEFERFLQCFVGFDNNNFPGTSERLIHDCKRFLDALLPDNAHFTDGTIDVNDNDCDSWERRLGLVEYGVTSSLTPTRLQRMAAIEAKQFDLCKNDEELTGEYMQLQLRAAGFDVYVYDNVDNLSPGGASGGGFGVAMSGFPQCGQVQCGQLAGGGSGISKIANHVVSADDDSFVIPVGNYHGLFFISGAALGTPATVPAVREKEFRQKVLNLKSGHLIGIAFVNYT